MDFSMNFLVCHQGVYGVNSRISLYHMTISRASKIASPAMPLSLTNCGPMKTKEVRNFQYPNVKAAKNNSVTIVTNAWKINALKFTALVISLIKRTKWSKRALNR